MILNNLYIGCRNFQHVWRLDFVISFAFQRGGGEEEIWKLLLYTYVANMFHYHSKQYFIFHSLSYFMFYVLSSTFQSRLFWFAYMNCVNVFFIFILLRSSSILFRDKKWGRLLFMKNKVIFYWQKWGFVPLAKNVGRPPFSKNVGRPPFSKNVGRLPFKKNVGRPKFSKIF